MAAYKVYHNGSIYTVDKKDSNWHKHPKNIMIVKDRIIDYIGFVDNIQSTVDRHCGGNTSQTFVDLEGCTVLPGIHDVHLHPLEASSKVEGTFKLETGIKLDSKKVIEKIRRAKEMQKGTQWILGHGHSIYDLLDHIFKYKGRPPREILDEAISDQPVVILEETSHSVWVNSKALDYYMKHLESSGGKVTGGIIMRDKIGKPNGILLENAAIEIFDLALEPTSEMLQLDYEGLLEGLKTLSENGITSVCDARCFWKRKHDEVWVRAEKEGFLNLRVILDLWMYPNLADDQQIPELKKRYRNSPDSLIRRSQVKVYSDGLIANTTAALLKPYIESIEIEDLGNTGMNYVSEMRLASYIEQLQYIDENNGFDFHIHAIGDRGVRESLNAIESVKESQNPKRKSRHRLTHLELIHADDIERFKDIEVIADFQVAGEYSLPKNSGEMADFVGKQRAKRSIPVESVRKTGAVVTLSSDYDVNPVNPFVGIQNATQRGPESVDVKSAIEMYTINGAFVMRQEDRVGSLERGKEADFIVIDQDILKLNPKHISKTKVLETYFRGQPIFTRN